MSAPTIGEAPKDTLRAALEEVESAARGMTTSCKRLSPNERYEMVTDAARILARIAMSDEGRRLEEGGAT